MSTTETTEIEIIEPAPEVALYNLPLATIAEWKTLYGDLQIAGPDDKAGYTALRTARLFVRGKRLDVTKRTKELVAPIKLQIAEIEGVETMILADLSPLEKTLGDREDTYDAQVEEAKQQKLREAQARLSTRINFLISHGCSFNGSAYSIEGVHILDAEIPRMSDDEFTAKQQLVTLAYEIEQKRISDEAEKKREAEEEKTRLAKIETDRIAAEKLELQKEKDKLKADQEKTAKAQEAVAQEQRKAQEKIDEANRKIEADKKKLADEKQAEADKKAEADRVKKKAAEDKKQAEIDAKLIAAALPDREKLAQFALSLNDIVYPEVNIYSAVETIEDVRGLIKKVQLFIIDRADSIK